MNKMMNPRTVEDIIQDFKGRRAGIIKALTKDFEEFYCSCDPTTNYQCLYSFPNQEWEVKLPPLSPRSELPEPRLGINLVRDTMEKNEWLSMVALHSDAWLFSIASFYASKFDFDKADRKRLFNNITNVCSVHELVMQWKTLRKRAKTGGGGALPDDILAQNLLPRLPVRDLLKFRTVSKVWESLIDNPDFVSTQLEIYKENSVVSHFLVVYRPAQSWLGKERIVVRRGDTFRKVMELPNSFEPYESYELISHIDGLILVKMGIFSTTPRVVLWNPSINVSLTLPTSVFIREMREYSNYIVLGLGYDASCNNYKVIAIEYPNVQTGYNNIGKRYCATITGFVLVYTLGADYWDYSSLRLRPPTYWTDNAKQIFLNGAIHWINLGPNDVDEWVEAEESFIVSFDVQNEEFTYFELPNAMVSDSGSIKEKFPTVLGESLAVYCVDYQDQKDIWVMKEYGVPDSWCKCYTFKLKLDRLLHFKSNGEIVFAVNGEGIKSYDIEGKSVKDLAKTYSRRSDYKVLTFVESLVLRNQASKRLVDSSQP